MIIIEFNVDLISSLLEAIIPNTHESKEITFEKTKKADLKWL